MDARIYSKRELCTGCTACAASCPKRCIQMEPDERGFLYPVIDEAQCIHCGICKKVCHTYHQNRQDRTPKLYGYTVADDAILKDSSSGGAFSSIVEKILDNNGYVCGAVYDSTYHFVHHVVSNELSTINQMRGAKYVQSDMGGCYQQIKHLLDKGGSVLFTGTPCQVLGLKFYLGGEYDRLYTVDVICHSVPSPLVFNRYINLLEAEDGDIKDFTFRDKKYGWEHYSIYYRTVSGERYLPHKGNRFMDGFLDGLYHRECCNQCPVKTRTNYQSDLTIGDFWGVQINAPEIYNPAGVSAILVNTIRGWKLIEDLNLKPCSYNSFIERNPKYCECVCEGEKAELFWKVFEKRGLRAAFHAVYKIPLIIRAKTRIKKVIQKSKPD